MNIGIVCYPTYGGSGIVATELGMDLAKKGHEVHFISYSLPARLDITLPNVFYHPVNVEKYPLFEYQPYSLALSTLMVQLVKKYELQILHVHYAIPHAYAAYIAKQILKEEGIELPVVTTLHGTDITLVGSHPVYKSAVEFSINKSDVVTSVSESLRQDTFEVFDVKKEIEVIPNFIDIQLFEENKPCFKSNFAPKGEKILIHVSNLRPVKRVQDVIEVFYRVQQEIPAILLIVGEGPEWQKAQLQINRLGIGNKVKSIGKVQKLHNILCSADLFLLPSEQESFGLAALEAMAARTPVISSNAGGLKEVNEDGFTGYTCEIGDTKDMATKALKILSNQERLETFKRNARQRAETFDKPVILPQYEELYEKLIKKLAY